MNAAVRRAAVDRFLRTGEYTRRGSRQLLEALIGETRRRQGTVPPREPPSVPGDLRAFTRVKVQPMVRGLFPRNESEKVLSLLERSVVFLTSDNYEAAIRQCRLLNTSWEVANLYLSGIGAEPFSEKGSRIVGFSADSACYVSVDYFREEDPFADFVVHEVAHTFHNTKRSEVGLPETRRREWLLSIHFSKRETFAYACEVYSRVVEKGKSSSKRRELVQKLGEEAEPPDDRVDPREFFSILIEAVSRRNGWKAILERCSA